ncbi:DUF3139 domain-containing protein [Listeria sp. PSOL-1]|uniref:DUF3139 domain-containing protein n=1 Tax=Listeria sp. PSOL-1 TaxID=1844999 RepID=UPI0013D78C46|nr:DUF3139 domain-containing protein [Listeria sp. PSOL-1]
MKKWKIVLLVLLILIVVAVLGYLAYTHLKTNQANKRIDQTIKSANIPDSEIIVLRKPTYNSEVFGSEWFTKVITTKKDYQTWKNMVKKKHKFLNGEELTNKNEAKLNSVKNCELTYELTYESVNRSVRSVYGYGENSATKQQVETDFSYRISRKDF